MIIFSFKIDNYDDNIVYAVIITITTNDNTTNTINDD